MQVIVPVYGTLNSATHICVVYYPDTFNHKKKKKNEKKKKYPQTYFHTADFFLFFCEHFLHLLMVEIFASPKAISRYINDTFQQMLA